MSDNIQRSFITSVEQAVSSTISKQKPLFVYLVTSGYTENTDTFLPKFIDEQTSAIIKSNFILLKLTQNTVEFGYFSQLFKDLIVPSFYIVNEGKIEAVISNDTTKEEFIKIIGKLTKHTPSINNTSSHESRHTENNVVVESSRRNHSKPSSDHDKSVRKYQEGVARMRQEKIEEKKRLRALLEADQKERKLKEQENAIAESETSTKSPSTKQTSPSSTNSCVLSIKLFDGSTMKREFKAHDTLVDVRKWLDSEVEIIPPAKSMPSFATTAYPYPTGYAFHRPALPRVTYSEEQESNTLADLDLTPRSALILKPTYNEVDSDKPDNDIGKTGIFRSLLNVLFTLGATIFSVFSYGVNAPHNQERRDSSPRNDHNETENLQSSEDDQSVNIHRPSIAGHPGSLMFESTSASSLFLNIEPDVEETSGDVLRPHSPPVPIESHFNQYSQQAYSTASNINSRPTTPGSRSLRQMPTVHGESKETSSKKEQTHNVDSYNGNSINVHERDDETPKD
ncbi:UBX-domain (ubiquitin-regulatory domain) protein, putative [Candida dubliniensis CD36]|uniref:UBX-domain (Ubiquitin-regulatory domain) protein, putative n=1 Tax=Candida dubliniensis (strain CD36 / ATCC MYA-646 / CBS 7987 / NCPF 3949 / NRRL Y-17841) TaxID=573826 RepID=B9W6X7_CANDC|nr:UBX-domain (ubiquitin-regulatory domain) protein, putative [Candida dubliniensis CD36]CAX44435.1 UBX-domain (ubiquitin-regulatory domain) protein, putative [Candida dubliniensis CD36]